ncbi:MAG: hypothetical protein QM640_01450 [Niabella sp.]
MVNIEAGQYTSENIAYNNPVTMYVGRYNADGSYNYLKSGKVTDEAVIKDYLLRHNQLDSFSFSSTMSIDPLEIEITKPFSFTDTSASYEKHYPQ